MFHGRFRLSKWRKAMRYAGHFYKHDHTNEFGIAMAIAGFLTVVVTFLILLLL
jgi:hypothetical protein